MDYKDHEPACDAWLSQVRSFEFLIGASGIIIKGGRVRLFFHPNKETGKFDYGGWETFVGDMGLPPIVRPDSEI